MQSALLLFFASLEIFVFLDALHSGSGDDCRWPPLLQFLIQLRAASDILMFKFQICRVESKQNLEQNVGYKRALQLFRSSGIEIQSCPEVSHLLHIPTPCVHKWQCNTWTQCSFLDLLKVADSKSHSPTDVRHQAVHINCVT